MLNLTYRDYPDLASYKNNLTLSQELMKSQYGDNEIYIDAHKVHTKINYDLAMYNTTRKLLLDHMNINSNYSFLTLSRDEIIRYLLSYENIPYDLLEDKKTGRLSLDQTRVLRPLYDKGYANEFLEIYFAMKDYDTRVSRCKSLITESTPTDLADRNGNPLNALAYSISVANTGRVYTNNYNIQAIHKDYLSAISVPKDYVLFWCDFSQIDLRVMYNIFLRERGSKADKVFSQCEDKYEAIARIMHMQLGDEFDPEEFKKNRKDYKTGVLARAYNAHKQTLSRSIRDEQFLDSLDRFFKKNKRYQEYFQDVSDVVDFGMSMVITDYFGYERTIPIVIDRKNDAIAQGMNSPIQSTSNSIVVNMVNAIISKYRSLGFSLDKARVYMCRHDEVVLLLHKDVLPYLWVLKDLTTVQVDDWDILTTEPNIGYAYGECNEELFELMLSQWQRKEFQMTPRKVIPRDTEYQPIGKAALAGLGITRIPDSNKYTVCACLSLRGDKPTLHVLKDLAEDSPQQAYDKYIDKLCTYLASKGYPCLELCDLEDLAESSVKDGFYLKVNNVRKVYQDEATDFLNYYLRDLASDQFNVVYIDTPHTPQATTTLPQDYLEETNFFSDFEEV